MSDEELFIDKAIKTLNLNEVERVGDIPISIDYSNAVIPFLHFSILSGEFVNDDYISKLEELKKVATDEIDNVIDKIIKFSTFVKDSLGFGVSTNKTFVYLNETSKVFSFQEIKNLELGNIGETKHKEDIILLTTNLLLAELDHSLECTEQFLRLILKIYHVFHIALKENGEKKPQIIQEILKEKCEFLMYKVLRRLGKEEIYDDVLPDRRINLDQFRDKSKYFKGFYEKVDLVYKSNDFYKLSPSDKAKINAKGNLSNFEIHLFSKTLYKSNDKDSDDFLNILEQLVKEYPDEKNQLKKLFNTYAYNNAIFLLEKNRTKVLKSKISAFLATEAKSDKSNNTLNVFAHQLTSLYTNTCRITKDDIFFIDDYYHHYLFSQIAAIIIEHCYLNSYENFSLLDIGERLLNFIRANKIEEKIDSSLEWIRAKKYLPAYSSYDECFLGPFNILDVKLSIFLDTSYVLPINYTVQQQRCDELKRKLQYLELLSNRYKHLNKELTIIKDNYERNLKKHADDILEKINNNIEVQSSKIDEQLREQSTSGIQSLGLFSAILALVIGGFNMIPKVSNAWFLIVFLLFFSACLILFVLALSKVIEKNTKSKNKLHYITICIFIIIGFVILYLTQTNNSFKNCLPFVIDPIDTTAQSNKPPVNTPSFKPDSL